MKMVNFIFMEKQTELELHLREILEKKEFQKILCYKERSSWENMSLRERDILGILFAVYGESLLPGEKDKALSYFDLAVEAAPENGDVYYTIGIALSEMKDSGDSLKRALSALEKAIELNPESYKAWRVLGVVLLRLGLFHHELSYLQQAHQKFLKAEVYSKSKLSSQIAELYWFWGLTWYAIGKLSEEACDYHHALEKYAKADHSEVENASFWIDYGNALVELSLLVGNSEMLGEALKKYQKGLEIDPSNFRGWYYLGNLYKALYCLRNSADDFRRADEAFQKASAALKEASSKDSFHDLVSSFWLAWAVLYLDFGRETQDTTILRKSFEKFARADSLDMDRAIVQSKWGEAQVLCGKLMERLDLLRLGEEKIIESTKIDPANAEYWRLSGMSLNELGRYFSDESFYIKAIEKLKTGLSLKQNDPMLWYTLALSYFSLADLKTDFLMMEQALQYFARATEFSDKLSSQFWNDWGVALLKISESLGNEAYAESAIEKFEKAITLAADDINGNIDPEWLYNYGCALDFMGDFLADIAYYEKAVEVLSKAVSINPDYSHAKYNLALAYSHIGESVDDVESFYKANDLFEDLVKNENEDEFAWNDWGLALLNLAQILDDSLQKDKSDEYYRQAEKKLLQAAGLGCLSALYNLACLYSLKGSNQMSMHYLEKAEALGCLPPVEEVLEDEWLKNVRETSDFRHFIAEISYKERHDEKEY